MFSSFDIKTLNDLLPILLFVVPGYVTYSVLAVFNKPVSDSNTTILLKAFVYGSINASIVLIVLRFSDVMTTQDGVVMATQNGVVMGTQERHFPNITKQDILNLSRWSLIFGLFLQPLLIGILFAIIQKTRLLFRVLKLIRLEPFKDIKTGWDFKFEQNKNSWVIITLQDDSVLYGYFGKNSSASSGGDMRDIFLEKTAFQQKNGWKIIENSEGILVKGENIKYIEFIGYNVPKAGRK